jgi:hypothetical protein
MKKMILTLAIAIGSLTSFAREAEVTQKVLDAFNSEFNQATEVSWTVTKDYYKATFMYNDRYVFAYYTENGELLAMTRYISSDDLPLSLITSLKKNYGDYWISDLFEMAKNEGTQYVVTLENADSKLILKASSGTWSVHQKIRKA